MKSGNVETLMDSVLQLPRVAVAILYFARAYSIITFPVNCMLLEFGKRGPHFFVASHIIPEGPYGALYHSK